jgi:F0F1-type ATP synthase delta subunit
LSFAIFGSGLVVGGAGALLTLRQQLLRAIHHPDEAPARIAARLRSKLALSDQQAERVEQILRERQGKLEAIRRRVQPEVMAELRLLEQQVGATLDETQRTQWEARLRELRETWTPPLPDEPAPSKRG